MFKGLNKVLLKNTIYLYLRMLILMVVSLITIRIVLDVLGPIDYGIFVLVGGFVAILGFFNGTMTSATQRFYAYDLGLKDSERLKQTFSLSFIIILLISLSILIITETLGLWFVQNKLEIPINRYDSAIIVYHLSIMSLIISMITIPYKSLVIAYEHMDYFAFVGIIESFIKLLLICILYYINGDNLIYYSLIYLISSILVFISYFFYCKSKFLTASLIPFWKKNRAIDFGKYFGWILFGSISKILKNHGVNIIINLLSFDLIVNTARSISSSFESAIKRMSTNFYNAVRPQITKSYSSSNLVEMKTLIFQSSKLIYCLLLILSIPFYLEIDRILQVWLKNVPDFVEIFCKLSIINALIEILFLPIGASIQATGNISLHQKITSAFVLLNLPLCYLFLARGYSPEVIMYISIIISLISLIPRLIIQQKTTKIQIGEFFNKVILKVILVTIISFFIVFVIDSFISYSAFKFIFTFVYSFLITTVVIYIICFEKNEKKKLRSYLKKKLIGKK